MSLHNLPKSAWLAALQHTELTQISRFGLHLMLADWDVSSVSSVTGKREEDVRADFERVNRLALEYGQPPEAA
jgi:hypothetical protein